MNELKEITKVDKNLLDKIEHILASELSCEEYDMFYNYFNEIRKPNILIDIKDDKNIKELINNLQSKIDKAIELIEKEGLIRYFRETNDIELANEFEDLYKNLKEDK